MGNKLEQLLNSLIEKGWKPFGESRIEEINRAEQYVGNWNWCCWGGAMQKRKSIRQLVSKESGLWQFCVEKKLTNQDKDDVQRWTHQFRRCVYDEDCWMENNNLYNDDYEYRLIESSLKDESELEQFLLTNIKVDE